MNPADHGLAVALNHFDRVAERGICDTGRYRCRYLVCGNGPPLVFLAGASCDARSFALVMTALADRFRCIAYDLPAGRGDGANLGRYAHADLVADLFALLDHLKLAAVYLYGFSFGSTIALAALRSHPERVPRAILQGGFARRRLAPAEVLLVRLLRHWQAPMRALPWGGVLQRRGHFGPFAGQSDALWRFFLERTGTPPIAAVAQRLLLLHQFDMREKLAAITLPVLVVSGDVDPLVNTGCTEELVRGLPHARHIELTDCGHYAIFTHPTVLADAIGRFLLPPPCQAETPLSGRPVPG